jgi:hypothetical protein
MCAASVLPVVERFKAFGTSLSTTAAQLSVQMDRKVHDVLRSVSGKSQETLSFPEVRAQVKQECHRFIQCQEKKVHCARKLYESVENQVSSFSRSDLRCGLLQPLRSVSYFAGTQHGACLPSRRAATRLCCATC